MALNNSGKTQDQTVNVQQESEKTPAPTTLNYQFETPTKRSGHRRVRRVIHRTRDIEHVMVHGRWQQQVDVADHENTRDIDEISPVSSSDCFKRRLEAMLKLESNTPSTPSWHVGVDGPGPYSPFAKIAAPRAPPTFTPSPLPKRVHAMMGQTWKRSIKKSQSKTRTMGSHQRKVSKQAGKSASSMDMVRVKKAIDFSVELNC